MHAAFRYAASNLIALVAVMVLVLTLAPPANAQTARASWSQNSDGTTVLTLPDGTTTELSSAATTAENSSDSRPGNATHSGRAQGVNAGIFDGFNLIHRVVPPLPSGNAVHPMALRQARARQVGYAHGVPTGLGARAGFWEGSNDCFLELNAEATTPTWVTEVLNDDTAPSVVKRFAQDYATGLTEAYAQAYGYCAAGQPWWNTSVISSIGLTAGYTNAGTPANWGTELVHPELAARYTHAYDVGIANSRDTPDYQFSFDSNYLGLS